MNKENSRAAVATKVAPLTSSEPQSDIDWGRVRIDAAIAAMQGFNANPAFETTTIYKIVDWSITQADALIAKLKKGASK